MTTTALLGFWLIAACGALAIAICAGLWLLLAAAEQASDDIEDLGIGATITHHPGRYVSSHDPALGGPADDGGPVFFRPYLVKTTNPTERRN